MHDRRVGVLSLALVDVSDGLHACPGPQEFEPGL